MKQMVLAILAVGVLAFPVACTRGGSQPGQSEQQAPAGIEGQDQEAAPDQGGSMGGGAGQESQPGQTQPDQTQPGQTQPGQGQ